MRTSDLRQKVIRRIRKFELTEEELDDLIHAGDLYYDPECEDGFSGANYFPDGMKRVKLYYPVERGFEREIKKRVDYFDNLRREKQKNKKTEQE